MSEPESAVVVCDHCSRREPDDTALVRCRCGGLLSVEQTPRFEGERLRERLRLSESRSGVWRYGELVHPSAIEIAVSHPEGNTPILHRDRLDRWSGIADLKLKHEGHNPTGSFKDRGMTVAVTQARRIGAKAVACASTGNTSASLAAYAAHAEIPAVVFVPKGQVAIGKLAQALAYGAHTLIVDGDFDVCLELVQRAGEELGIYLVNSINPFRVEGQKTIMLELLQQLDWQSPDWVVVPAGNLGNTAAFGKALLEARRWGLIDRLPRIAAVQALGASPFAAAFERGFDQLTAVKAETVATAIRIGDPASYRRAVRSIEETNGVVISVSDAEILAAKAEVDASGIGCEPASAASVAGARQLFKSGAIATGESVVAILTGHLLKDPGIVESMHQADSTLLESPNLAIPVTATLDAIRGALASRGVA